MTDRTNAERQRRYIARLKAHAAKTGVTNASGHAALTKELAQARTRIAELESALASVRQRGNTIQTQQQQRWTRKSADEKLIMRLKARIGELEALLIPLDGPQKDELARYKRKVDQEFKWRWKLMEKTMTERHMTMTSRDYGLIFAGFHPEAKPDRIEKARDHFVKLCERHVIHDKDKVQWPPPTL